MAATAVGTFLSRIRERGTMPSNHIPTAAVIGTGERGANVYGAYAIAHPDRLKMVACVNRTAFRRERFARQHGIPPEQLRHGRRLL